VKAWVSIVVVAVLAALVAGICLYVIEAVKGSMS
jgi:hypothetical protein